MKEYTKEEVLEHIQREWANNPLDLTEEANPVFSTVAGIQEQIESLYDNKGAVMFFVKKSDGTVNMEQIILNNEIPGNTGILG